jgi:hypothetical protein
MEMSVGMLEEVLIVRLKWFGWRWQWAKKLILVKGRIYEDKQDKLRFVDLFNMVKRRRESFPSPSNMP